MPTNPKVSRSRDGMIAAAVEDMMKNKQFPYLILNVLWIVSGIIACAASGFWFVWLYLGLGIGMVPFNLVTFCQNEIDASRQEMNDNGWHIDSNKVCYRLIREVEQPYLDE